MRIRKYDSSGDVQFGQSINSYDINSPNAVANAVASRLNLWLGEWFLDTSDGTAWKTRVLGKYTASIRDDVIRARVLSTPGVLSISKYSSSSNNSLRAFSVNMTIDTIYSGQAVIATRAAAYVPTPVTYVPPPSTTAPTSPIAPPNIVPTISPNAILDSAGNVLTDSGGSVLLDDTGSTPIVPVVPVTPTPPAPVTTPNLTTRAGVPLLTHSGLPIFYVVGN